MNISIDDTSPNFVWSNGQDDWRAQAPNEVSLNSEYFLQTYHATQTKGADVAITFVGDAIQIYGSKGPNHGNYSVTFDNTIKFFAGFSDTDQYQQLLFSRVFGSNLSETHTVELRNEEDYWLDLDFVVLTVSTTAETSTSDIGFFTSTVTPGTSVPPSSTDSTSTSDSNSSDGSSSAPSIFRTLTFALAGVLGFSILILLAWLFVSRKRRRSRGGGSGRGRGMSNSSSQQEFQYAQKNGQMSGLDTSNTAGAGEGNRGFGRNKFAMGKEDYVRSPTSAGGSTEMSRYSRHDGGINNINNNNNTLGGGGGAGTNQVVSGAARETLIALNNMGKRPGYRTLAGDAEGGAGSRSSVAGGGGGGLALGDGRETPTSLRTMGSAGQVWLGATRPHNDRDRDRGGGGGGERDSTGVRFKGRAGRESYNLLNKRSSSYGSDSNLSSRLAMQDRSRGGGGGGLEHINDSKDEDPYSGIGLGMYAANLRSESDQQRMIDLKRSASVASSGILDRLTSSPPPAVPELPPSATTSSLNSSRMDRMVPPPRNFSPTPTDGSTVYSHGGVHSGLGLATKVQHPYGRNNEMLVHSHSGSLNSTSGVSATTTAVNNGSLPLRPPPPSRVDERERERAMQRERERLEKEREANAERLHQREREMQRNAEARYSRAPPEYAPTPMASQTSMATMSAVGSGGDLQRQGTRTGDIPIGLDGAVGYGYESESQDSHSVAHAYVSTAQHVTVSPPTISQQQQPPSRIPPQSFSQQQQQQPPRPQHHVQRDGQIGSTGSSNLGLPHSTVTGTSAKRAVTPDRSYDPGRAIAVASGARSNTPTGMAGSGQQQQQPAWVGRASEESSKTWGLDGVHGAEKMRTAPAPGLGRPIMDDRTRLAVGAAGGMNQTGQRVSRVPPPRE